MMTPLTQADCCQFENGTSVFAPVLHPELPKTQRNHCQRMAMDFSGQIVRIGLFSPEISSSSGFSGGA
jgi:hypothetical protein